MGQQSTGQLAIANERRAREAEEKVVRALEEIAAEGGKATFYGVAKRSGVSRGALYASDGLRAMVEAARSAQKLLPIYGNRGLVEENQQLKAKIADLERRVAEPAVRRCELRFDVTWRWGSDGLLEVDFLPLAS